VEINDSTSKIISSVDADCTTTPFRRVSSRSPRAAAGSSSGVSSFEAERAGAVEILADRPLW
jgi:hypothetical protein